MRAISLSVRRGESIYWGLHFLQEDGAPVDLSGAALSVDCPAIPALSINVVDATRGRAELYAPESATTLSPGRYKGRLVLRFPLSGGRWDTRIVPMEIAVEEV